MSHEQGAHKSWVSRICYAIGNLGQAAFYNALSTFFVTYYAAQTLFRDYEAEEATAMIGIITALVFIIRIVEIFIDPLLGNLVDNTTTRWGRFKPWQVIGGVDLHRTFWPGQRQQGCFHRRLHHRLRGARRPVLAA